MRIAGSSSLVSMVTNRLSLGEIARLKRPSVFVLTRSTVRLVLGFGSVCFMNISFLVGGW